jgi:NAD(P) transhydrogenase subunit alpha
VPSLLGEDASELYAKNQYNLLALMMKDNVITIDWNDEVLAGTVLTHAGENKAAISDKAAKAAAPPAKAAPAKAVTPTTA